MTTESLTKALGITLDMIERRDQVRRLWGDRYEAKVAPAKAMIKKYADRHGKSLAATALDLCRPELYRGISVGIIVAALVDLCEGGGGQ